MLVRNLAVSVVGICCDFDFDTGNTIYRLSAAPRQLERVLSFCT